MNTIRSGIIPSDDSLIRKPSVTTRRLIGEMISLLADLPGNIAH